MDESEYFWSEWKELSPGHFERYRLARPEENTIGLCFNAYRYFWGDGKLEIIEHKRGI